MKKTLEAVKAKEDEIIEAVEQPFVWALKHWVIVGIVVLAIAAVLGIWQYHLVTTQAAVDAAWRDSAAIDKEFAQKPAEAAKKRLDLAERTDLPLVQAAIKMDAATELLDARRLEEAQPVLESVLAIPAVKDTQLEVAAKRSLDYITRSLAWRKESGGIAPSPPSTGENPLVRFRTTQGVFEVELFEDATPNHTANMIELVTSGYYSGVVVHRVDREPVGVVQFGRRFNSPEGASVPEEGPGYRIRAEIRPDLHHTEGTVAMARTSSLDSGGAQIFINTTDNSSSWDGRYTVFGKVLNGMDVVKLLIKDKDVILSAEVLRKRDHAYTVEKLPLEQ